MSEHDAAANPPSILAVIPHYRNRHQLDRCLAALEASTVPVKPWVYDNTPSNIGFTRAVNLGLKVAFGNSFGFALVLNQDCYVAPDAVANLVKFMDEHPRCAIAGVKQLASADPDFIMHAGCTTAYPQGKHCIGRKSRGDHTVSRPMPWVNGAALFVRMPAVLEFGLMDERMIMLGSDSDWCYRARIHGWEVWYCADAEAVHEQGITTQPATSPELQRVFLNDMAWWKNKWVGTVLFNQLVLPIEYPGPPADPQSTPPTAAAVGG